MAEASVERSQAMSDPGQEVAAGLVADAIKSSPLLAYFFAVASGFTMEDWAATAALVWTLLLIAEKLWKLFWPKRAAALRE